MAVVVLVFAASAAIAGVAVLIDRLLWRRLRRQAASVAAGGRLAIRVRARAVADPSSATYGDIVIEQRSAWWFEAGSSVGEPLARVRVRKVGPGDGLLDYLPSGKPGVTRFDLQPCGVTVETHPSIARLLVPALRRARSEGGPVPSHRARSMLRPAWPVVVFAGAAGLVVAGFLMLGSAGIPVQSTVAGYGQQARERVTWTDPWTAAPQSDVIDSVGHPIGATVDVVALPWPLRGTAWVQESAMLGTITMAAVLALIAACIYIDQLYRGRTAYRVRRAGGLLQVAAAARLP